MDQNTSNYSPIPQPPMPPIEVEPAKKSNSPILYFAATSIVVVLVFTGIILFQNSQNRNSSNLKKNSIIPTVGPTAVVTPAMNAVEIFPPEQANPFIEEETYQNPFEDSASQSGDYQNPFEQ